MVFQPDLNEPNYMSKEELSEFQAYLDYGDMESANIMKLINEQALHSDNAFIKKKYKFDYIIQINLFTVNGLTLKRDFKQPPTQSIANIFFKFQHKDMDKMILTSKNQKKIVRQVYDRLQTLMKEYQKTELSGTFAPYYDIILDEN